MDTISPQQPPVVGTSFSAQVHEAAGEDDKAVAMITAIEQAQRELTAERNNPFVAGCVLISKTLEAIAVAQMTGGASESKAHAKK